MLQVDLLDRASLRAAFDGCDGVIHTASPMNDNPVSATATTTCPEKWPSDLTRYNGKFI
jgi:uncharacterized protein YbjT (DUF2867 family)